MTKEALKLALEALEVCEQSNYGRNWVWPDTAHPTAMANVKEAITAIKEALAQPEQEPVAWRVSYQNDPELGFWFAEGIGGEGCLNEPLYTTPPQRKPLTDARLVEIELSLRKYTDGDRYDLSLQEFARAIEAAHGIKGDA